MKSEPESSVLTDLSPAKLANAVEQNQVQWTKNFGRLPDVELHCDRDVTWTFSTNKERPNYVCAPRFKPDSVEARIDEILHHYHEHCKAVIWWVGPSATPSDLGKHLRDRGLRCRKHVPGMAVDLQNMNEELPKPRSLTIDLIEDLSVMERFDHPSVGRTSASRRAAHFDNMTSLARMKPQCFWHFIASLSGKPLGVSTLFVGAGVAGVYAIEVIPKARRQGIGTAITVASLQFARDLGYRAAILQASGKGEGIYNRIGFQRVCTISHWHYPRAKSFHNPEG